MNKENLSDVEKNMT